MRRVLTWIVLAVILAGSLGTVCGATTVRIALDWTPNTNHTGILVARAADLFANEGLEVGIIEPGPTVAIQLVAAGRAEFGITSQEYVTIARSQGLRIVSVATLYPHNTSGFASPSDRGIQSASDLAGKQYGGWGSDMEQAMIETVLEGSGADPEAVSILNIGTLDFTSAVRLDVADFYWIYYGWQGVHAELEGIAFDYLPLADLAEVLDYYTPVIVVSEALIAEQPDVIAAFLRALVAGYVQAALQPDDAAEVLLAYAPELDRELVVQSQRWLAQHCEQSVDAWGLQEEIVWTAFADWAAAHGVIDTAIDGRDAFTNDFLPGGSSE